MILSEVTWVWDFGFWDSVQSNMSLRLDRESIMSSPRYGFSTPYRFTIRNSTTLFNIVLFNMGDLHLVLPVLNLSNMNAGHATRASLQSHLSCFKILVNEVWKVSYVGSHRKNPSNQTVGFLRKCNFNFLQCKKLAHFCRFWTFPSLRLYFNDFWDWKNVPKRWPDISRWL